MDAVDTNTTHASASPGRSTQRRRHQHRHTQSLGLLSPIPSRSSLRSDDGDASPLTTTSTAAMPATTSATSTPSTMETQTPPHKPASTTTPTTPTTTTPSTTPSRRLPALLVGLGHALAQARFPGSAPSSPRVASTPMGGYMSGGNGTGGNVGNVVAPQPRRGHGYSLSLSVSPFHPHPQQELQRPSSAAGAAGSRSEQLLRDALRRGSVSGSSSPLQQQRRAASVTGHRQAPQQVYGGDAEGGSSMSSAFASHQHQQHQQHQQDSSSLSPIAKTLSRLEGRSSSPSRSSTRARDADPEHEALRARLERVLAGHAGAAGSASAPGSRRASSVFGGARRQSGQAVMESPRSSLSSHRSSQVQQQREHQSQQQEQQQGQEEEESMPALERTVTTPTPRATGAGARGGMERERERESPRTPTPRRGTGRIGDAMGQEVCDFYLLGFRFFFVFRVSFVSFFSRGKSAVVRCVSGACGRRDLCPRFHSTRRARTRVWASACFVYFLGGIMGSMARRVRSGWILDPGIIASHPSIQLSMHRVYGRSIASIVSRHIHGTWDSADPLDSMGGMWGHSLFDVSSASTSSVQTRPRTQQPFVARGGSRVLALGTYEPMHKGEARRLSATHPNPIPRPNPIPNPIPIARPTAVRAFLVMTNDSLIHRINPGPCPTRIRIPGVFRDMSVLDSRLGQ
ncbi:hypothetical protein C8R46DRAFT_1137987 [Mycena filopes]|nr:hypothetical protein C8R46DRAFT_1137987 [Mycena filopes]